MQVLALVRVVGVLQWLPFGGTAVLAPEDASLFFLPGAFPLLLEGGASANRFAYPEPMEPGTAAALCDFFRPFNAQLVDILKRHAGVARTESESEDAAQMRTSEDFLDGFHWHCVNGNRAISVV